MSELVQPEEFFRSLPLRWEWRDGATYRALRRTLRPAGSVVERADGGLAIALDDDPSVVVAVESLVADGCRFWYAESFLATTPKGSGSDLVNRLHGIYHIPVNDGAGPLDGSYVFTQV